MSEPTVSVAWIGLLGIIFGGLLTYLKFFQGRKDKKDKDDRDEEARIIKLMVDDFESLRAETAKSRTELGGVWDQVRSLQRQNWDCEQRCLILSRKVDELEHEVAILKLQLARGSP